MILPVVRTLKHKGQQWADGVPNHGLKHPQISRRGQSARPRSQSTKVPSDKAEKKATCCLNAKPSTVIDTILSQKNKLRCTWGRQKKNLQWQHTLYLKNFHHRALDNNQQLPDIMRCHTHHSDNASERDLPNSKGHRETKGEAPVHRGLGSL